MLSELKFTRESFYMKFRITTPQTARAQNSKACETACNQKSLIKAPHKGLVFKRWGCKGWSYKRFALPVIGLMIMSGAVSCKTSSPTYIDDISPEAKLFGEYLAGSYANYLEDAPARSHYLSRAFARAQDDQGLGRRALSFALTAGDMDLARTLAIELNQAHPNEPMARAVLGGRALSKGQYDKALEFFDGATPDLTMSILMQLMKGWAQVGAGDSEAAKATFSGLDGGQYFGVIGALENAKIDTLSGDLDSAFKVFDTVKEFQVSGVETALSIARAKSQSGDVSGAYDALKQFSDENGQFETGPVRAYLDQLKSGQPIDEVLSVQAEAARALTEPAFGFFAVNRAFDAAEVFLRMAVSLDPEHDKASLWLGSILENSERSDEALAIYQSIPDTSHYIVSAKLASANIYFDRDEDKAAMRLLEDVHAKHPSFVTREALGRARLVRENYAEALPIYDALVKSLTEEEIQQNTQPLYFRAICYERTKQFDLAVRDFKRILAINPDDADTLNYLGYTWVDRGENLTEAFEMIRKAVKLEPQSGAIVDSLGWAHYKLGQYSLAKEKLEDAVELSPASATIVDHLGDVYWKLGRKREARYQWERALTFDPTDEERANIRVKLKQGLDALTVAP